MKRIVSFILAFFILIWVTTCYFSREKYTKYIGKSIHNNLNNIDINIDKIYEYNIKVQNFIGESLKCWGNVWELCNKYINSNYDKVYYSEAKLLLNTILSEMSDMNALITPKGAEVIGENTKKIQLQFKEIIYDLSFSIKNKNEIEMKRCFKEYMKCYEDIVLLIKLLKEPIYNEI